ncbi:MAG: helix-turn-helix transcriptional regulator [Ignavibacteria bacterium]|nr:helix-turn-helix transcriptional regulator [Ignavibacteria bacterium]
MNSIIDIIAIITSFLLIFFSAFLLVHKKGNLLSKKLLAFFLFVNAIFMIDYLIGQHLSDQYYFKYYYLFYFSEIASFLFGPLLYLYTCSVAYSNFKLKRIDYLHLIPAIFFAAYFLIHFIFYNGLIVSRIELTGNAFTQADRLSRTLFFNLQVFSYLIFSLVVLKKYRAEIKKYYSSVEKMNLYWLEIILFGFILMWIIDLASTIIFWMGINLNNFESVLSLLSISTNFIVANILIFWGLKRPEILEGFDRDIKEKSERHFINDSDKQKLLKQLNEFMETERIYFKSSLTISDLAQRSKIPQRTLSYLINSSYHPNFFDFINSYRIEEAKKILSDTEKKKLTILEILYEVGFNSKSVFNTVFKKNTGLTPTDYRKSMLSESKKA